MRKGRGGTLPDDVRFEAPVRTRISCAANTEVVVVAQPATRAHGADAIKLAQTA